MKKILKWLSISIVTIIVLLAAAGICVSVFFGQEVVNLIVGELNKNLNVEIRVGTIDFTVFKRFPDASIEFTDVIAFSSKNIAKDHFKHNADTLLVAKKLFLQFNVWDIVEKRYKIKAIHLENAYVQILMDKNGENNFQIMKDTSSSTQSDTASLSLNLKKVSIKNSVFVFDDRGSAVLSRNRIQSIAFSGNFKDEDFVLKSKASLIADDLTIADKRYLNNNQVEYDIELDVHKKQLHIKSAELALKKIQIAVEGAMDFTRKPSFDLTFDISKFQIQAMLPYLPNDIQHDLQAFQLQGVVKSNGLFKGVVSEHSLPALELHFGVTGAQMLYNKLPVSIETQGLFKAKNLAQTQGFLLVLDTISATHQQCSYNGRALLSNFSTLDLQTTGQAAINLAQINRLFDIKKDIELQGSVETAVEFTGRLTEFDTITPDRLQNIIFKHNLQLRDVSVKMADGFAVNDVNGTCRFVNNRDLQIDSVQLQYKHIAAQASGTINNLLPYVLFSNETMRADLKVHTSCIDFDELTKKEPSKNQSIDSTIPTASVAQSSSGLGIPAGIVAVLQLSSDCFVTNKLSIKDLKTKLTLTSSQVVAEACSFNTMGGRINCDLLFQQLNSGYSLKTTANLTNIQAEKLFYSFNDFDQDFLTEKNIKGSITAKITMFADLSSSFDLNSKTLYAECSATIQNGRLINFAPMRKLSQFIEMSELENVTFKTLKNDFLIKNEVLYIPKMDIVSNAFEMSLFGEQAFSNAFDYHLKVLLNDILSKKCKKQQSQDEFGEIEDDGLGRVRLPLRIFGTTDKFDVKFDTKAVKEEIKESLKKEKSEISRIFKEEFNLGKKDTIVKPKKKPEEPEKLQIQWDD